MTKGFFRKSVRWNDLSLLLGVIIIILLVNIILQNLFFRIDLTTEKRYTLSRETKAILNNLDDVVSIKVYLKGELNIPFKKFQESIHDLLDELKVFGKSNLQYEFVNPFENVTKQMQGKIIAELYDKGLRPTNIYQRDKEGGSSEKIIFPSALITYKDNEIPLNLLLNNPGLGPEQNINNSIESLEFNFISTIKKTEKIAFTEGHGELNEYEVNDISVELSKSYQIDRGQINGRPGILNEYKAIIIAKPTMEFSEPDKFMIDQYIMNGGKVLWLIDAVQVNLDSLTNSMTMALIPNLNIDDLLFRYGIRINPVLVQDIQSNVIPVNVALKGNTPNFQPVPWFYYPLISPSKEHPVTQNLNLILCRFANSIDTIEARKGIRKIPLLVTSPISRIKAVPAIISLEEINENPKKTNFNAPNILVGTLLEGEFESAFKNRGISKYFLNAPIIVEKSRSTRMAVIADGDIIRNDVRYTAKGPVISPLGYDRFTRQTFGNKEFLVNLIQYMADDNNLLKLRSREFKLRLLDKEKITAHRSQCIVFNMVIPSCIVIILGIGFLFFRKIKYTRL
jgi:gliding-associated putative ABC transporter substrate-binding component GldG